MDKTILILLDVIRGLIAILDEQNLLLQNMINYIRAEAKDESS